MNVNDKSRSPSESAPPRMEPLARLPVFFPLQGKRVLDVGCGNGYYLWRMRGAGARGVIGIDPNWLFFCQFLVMIHFWKSCKAFSGFITSTS